MHSSWERFLPSKKIVIIVVILIAVAAAYVFVPKLIATKAKVPTPAASAPIVATVGGNPATRDSDGDGVPDWEEVAVGLDPNNPQSNPGTPDATTLETIKQNAGTDSVSQLNAFGDTDKISYTIFNTMTSNANQTGTFDDSTVADATSQELGNYVQSIAPVEKYATTNVPTVPSTPTSDAAYKTAVAKLGPIDILSNSFQTKLWNYLTTGSNASDVKKEAASIETFLPAFAAIPVPDAIVTDQVANLNALDGFATVLGQYDPTNTDPVYQLANQTLIKMYEWSIIKASADILNHYGDPLGPIMQSAQTSALQDAETQAAAAQAAYDQEQAADASSDASSDSTQDSSQ